MKWFLICIALVFMGSCSKNEPCFVSRGKTVEKKIRLSDVINQVSIHDDIEVEVRQDSGDYNHAIVRNGKNLLDAISLSLSAGHLTIKNSARCNWLRDLSKRPRVVLFLKDTLKQVEHFGSENITVYSSAHTFILDAWGSPADITHYGNHHTCYIRHHASSANTRSFGTCKNLFLYNTSSGNIDTEYLPSNYVYAANIKIGRIKFFASHHTDIRIHGKGNIEYNASVESYSIERKGSGEAVAY